MPAPKQTRVHVAPCMPFSGHLPALTKEAEASIAAMHRRFLLLFQGAPNARHLQHGLVAGRLAKVRSQHAHLLAVAETESDRLHLAQLEQEIQLLEAQLPQPAA